MNKKLVSLVGGLLAAAFAFSGCGSAASSSTQASAAASGTSAASVSSASGKMDKIVLQDKWLAQAQFMGYYVADKKGYYKDENIAITITPGSSDFTAEDQVINGTANFGHTWYSSLLTYQESGNDLINVSQIYQKSALQLVTKKGSGITTGKDLKGKKVGNWFGGNEYEIYALLGKYGYNKDKDVSLVQQDFTMDAFKNNEIDAASAMTYNEMGLVLDDDDNNMKNYQTIDMNTEGVAMMEDCLCVSKKWAEANKDLVVRFLRASLKGWQYACAHTDEAAQIVWDAGKSVSLKHQQFMAKKVAETVCPSGMDTKTIGKLDEKKLQQTIDLGKKYGLIKKAISLSSSIDASYWKEATGSTAS
ncbi:MAG: ABC transporter substrate-binding protein [Oscillospiraceae bacterium]|jgi:NitT/TauT family transport system substrate-binding protein|nr:ABC transporter substrate-binding protein [Oscillospiraceae bacterium]MDD3260769.1 ABC transporter substrate-binding protein [Oscillospiraceae bacterium]